MAKSLVRVWNPALILCEFSVFRNVCFVKVQGMREWPSLFLIMFPIFESGGQTAKVNFSAAVTSFHFQIQFRPRKPRLLHILKLQPRRHSFILWANCDLRNTMYCDVRYRACLLVLTVLTRLPLSFHFSPCNPRKTIFSVEWDRCKIEIQFLFWDPVLLADL